MATKTELHPLAEKPAHIPDSAVVHFDMFNDPDYLADPHKKILELHETAPPVFWTPYNNGVWMFLSYAANFIASRDTDLYSSQITPEDLIDAVVYSQPRRRRVPRPVPISMDPPEHGIFRTPLQKYFGPKTMMKLQDKIRSLARDLIGGIREDGHCEFMAAVAEPLPITVFLELLGLPSEQRDIYLPLAQAHFDALESEPLKLFDLQMDVADLMADTVQARRTDPRDDLISALWKMEFDGQPATTENIEDLCAILFLGGLDTVMNGMGFAAVHLARNPDLQRTLREDPTKIASAVEEMLRRYSFALPRRRITRDTELEGTFLKGGDEAVLFLPGANLDHRKFPNPETFDLDRENNAHIVFGAGPHRCVGAHLARIELQVMYEELLSILPEFRLDPAKELTYHGGHTMRPNTVWLQWNA